METAPKCVEKLNSRTPELPSRQNRRDHLLLGELPPDFLRITLTEQQQQAAADEQVAMAIHQQQTHQSNHGHMTYVTASGAVLPSRMRGRLDITIVEAHLVKNYGVTRMDPYVRLRVGHHIYETKTSYNGARNPKWGKVFHCFLPLGVDTIHMEIYDERAFTTDEKVAWALYNIPQEVLAGETREDWVQLNGRQGDGKEGTLGVVMSFTPMPASTTYVYPAPQPIAITTGGQGIGPVHVQPPAASPQPVVISEEDVKQIQDMFPSMDVDIIRTIMENERGNKDRTVNALLQMT